MTLHAVTKKNLTITGGGEQWRPFLHVMDAARAYLCCLQAPASALSGQAFNVIDQNIQLGMLGSLIGQRVSSDVTYVQNDRDLRSYHVSGQRFASQFHFQPHYSIKNGIDEVAEAITSGRLGDLNNPLYYTVQTLKKELVDRRV